MSKPKIVSIKKLNINLNEVDNRCIEIIEKLHKHKFHAYLVGGCIRDLLLNKHPKDFDIVTDASPEEVYKVFKNSRIIGKRFKIVHIFFRNHIIEVATFRADKKSNKNQKGMILRDNNYGTIDQDVWRRDFTINALYLDIKNKTIIDYAGGLEDLKRKVVKIIGVPETRYKEDPVRMIRAIRFAKKLDFDIENNTNAPIAKQAHLLLSIPPARLFEEYNKLFLHGSAIDIFKGLMDYNIFKLLFPQTFKAFHENNKVLKLIEHAIKNTDKRVKEKLPVAPGFLLAVFLWPIVDAAVKRKIKKGSNIKQIFDVEFDRIIRMQSQTVVIPRKIYSFIEGMLYLQFTLTKGTHTRPKSVIKKPLFKAAYDFLLIRGAINESDKIKKAAKWWNTKFEEIEG